VLEQQSVFIRQTNKQTHHVNYMYVLHTVAGL